MRLTIGCTGINNTFEVEGRAAGARDEARRNAVNIAKLPS